MPAASRAGRAAGWARRPSRRRPLAARTRPGTRGVPARPCLSAQARPGPPPQRRLRLGRRLCPRAQPGAAPASRAVCPRHSPAGPAERGRQLPRPPCSAAPRCPGATQRPTPVQPPPARPSAPPGRRLSPPRRPLPAPVLSAPRPAPLFSAVPAHPAQTPDLWQVRRRHNAEPAGDAHAELPTVPRPPPRKGRGKGVVWSQKSLGSARSACGGAGVGRVPAGLHVTSAPQVYQILFDFRSLYS